MGKLAKFALMGLFHSAYHQPEAFGGFGTFIVWLINAILVILIGALIVAGIAKLIGKDSDE